MSSACLPRDATIETGRLIRYYREQAGMSQQDLADRIGATQPAISRLEAGGVSPGMRTMERIAEALGCVVEWQMVPREQALNHGVPGTIGPAR